MEVIKFQKVEEACCSPAVTAKTHLLQRQRSGEELRACRGSSWYFRGGFRREGKAEVVPPTRVGGRTRGIKNQSSQATGG
ncbi:hypothetical protein Bca4012_049042 [Brassica carinata]